MKEDLLFELGVEELPPAALIALRDMLLTNVSDRLNKLGFIYASAQAFATHRRLAIHIEQLDTQQPDTVQAVKGPQTAAPEQAVQGFAKKVGVKVAALEVKTDGGKTYYVANVHHKGIKLSECLPELIQASLDALPIPKRMRWGSGDMAFIRPVRWAVLMLGSAVIPASFYGKNASNQTQGHRFHSSGWVTISAPNHYLQTLQDSFVIADCEMRKARIKTQIQERAKTIGAIVPIDESLLDEINALVEWPVAIQGDFDSKFLALPKACLIMTMTTNQKYFHLLNQDGALLPHFITIANLESTDPKTIKQGNEKVIEPRFQDAAFFYDNDRKTPLMDRYPLLEKVVFESNLGSLQAKVNRVAKLAVNMAQSLNVDPSQAEQAAKLCKCDLLTDMVVEFPSLQGMMGADYARNEGLDSSVCLAIEQHYQPKFSGDQLPSERMGQLLALADKMDTLCGIFSIGKQPTGTKDPYALRRQTIGMLRIILETKLPIDLSKWIQQSLALYQVNDNELYPRIMTFIFDRLQTYYSDQGVSSQSLQAIRSVQSADPMDFSLRLNALTAFIRSHDIALLSSANKRIKNMLEKANTLPNQINESLLSDPAELSLYKAAFNVTQTPTDSYFEQLLLLQNLADPLTEFFEKVMVLCDDTDVRNNRLSLLSFIRELFLQVSDFAELQL